VSGEDQLVRDRAATVGDVGQAASRSRLARLSGPPEAGGPRPTRCPRPPGRRRGPNGLLAPGDPDVGERLLAIARLIAGSPALLAREQQIYAGYAAALAALIAGETRARPDDIMPWVAANAMIGLHKALVDYVRRQVLAGERDQAGIARALRAQARQAVALLEHGLGHLGAAGVTAG
jgi:hypothetical protein